MAALSCGASSQPLLRIGGNDAPPYRIFSPGKASGIYIDIFMAIAREMGVGVEIAEMPMARALNSMRSGEIDVMLGPNRTQDREAYMSFLTEIPFPREDKAIYLATTHADVTSYSELAALRIGVLRGAVYGGQFDNDTSLKKDQVNDYRLGLRMLSMGRLDAVIIPEQEGRYLVARTGLELKKATLSLPGNESYIAISARSEIGMALRPRIIAAYRKLKSAGLLDSIMASYAAGK